MTELVELLLRYKKSNDLKLLVTSDMEIEQRNLNVIVTEILAWLKLEHKRSMWIEQKRPTCLKSLKLNRQFPWCIDLIQLVEREPFFTKYFKIENDCLDFSDGITENEKRVVREEVYKNFNPQMSITRRYQIKK